MPRSDRKLLAGIDGKRKAEKSSIAANSCNSSIFLEKPCHYSRPIANAISEATRTCRQRSVLRICRPWFKTFFRTL
jgi:hypothetical protein